MNREWLIGPPLVLLAVVSVLAWLPVVLGAIAIGDLEVDEP